MKVFKERKKERKKKKKKKKKNFGIIQKIK